MKGMIKNMKKSYLLTIQAVLSAVGAFLSDRLGILYPVLCLLLAVMILDYITGMLASKAEAIDHPGDSTYGWSSKKGAKGIIKKVGYLCVIATAMIVDFILMRIAHDMGIPVPSKVFFGLLVSIWYMLNELLSIIENAGRMGANVPSWLKNYIAVLREKIEETDVIDNPNIQK